MSQDTESEFQPHLILFEVFCAGHKPHSSPWWSFKPLLYPPPIFRDAEPSSPPPCLSHPITGDPGLSQHLKN